MSASDVNAQLLLGVLALQMDLISRDQLLAAARVWMPDTSRPLQELLVEQGALSDRDVRLLGPLVSRHIENHAGDPVKSLAALSSVSSLAEDLRSLGTGQLEATLSIVSTRRSTQPVEGTVVHEVSFRGAAAGDAANSNSTRFRIIRPHAKGGLGEVSVARDMELNRDVALKEIQSRYADDASSRARFLLEAEVTGGLEHPGIVPVYGLGRYADGRPFYAMRFIQGDSLKDAANRFHAARVNVAADHRVVYDSLEFRKLLGRFVDVCNAIEYAHSRGVLHRDLKPGNIMLGKYGETLVVDWGLAKVGGRDHDAGGDGEAVLQPSGGSGSAPTQLGTAIGTPAYMPPEQAAGKLDELGPESDVYSLGATLYYLLTGRAPIEGQDLATLLTKVTRGEFPSPRSIHHDIPKPLEAICLKAMATSSNDRYARPQDLAENVERFLADEPVAVYKEPVLVRVRRWIRKHPTSVAALVMLVLGLSGVALVQLRANNTLADKNEQLEEAQRLTAAARDRAQRRGDLAVEAIDRFRTAVEENVDVKNRPDLEDVRRALLQAPKEFYESLQSELATTAPTDREAYARLAHAEFKLAALSRTIDSQDRALEAYEASGKKFEGLLQASPGNVEYRVSLADIGNALGGMAMAQRDYDAAREQYGKSIALRRELMAEQPQEAKHPIAAARNLINLGMVEAAQGRAEPALALLAEARTLLGDVLSRDENNEDARHVLSRALETQGGILSRNKQRHDEALECLTEALNLAEGLAQDDPDNVERQSARIYILGKLGDAHAGMGQVEQAERFAGEALRLQQELVDQHPTYSNLQLNLTEAMAQVADVQFTRGEVPRSLESTQQVIALRRKLCDEHPSNTKYRDVLADALTAHGTRLYALGRRDESLQVFRDLVPVCEELVQLQPDDLDALRRLGGMYYNIGTIATQLKQDEEALAAFDKALNTRRQLAAKVPQDVRLQTDVAYTLGNMATWHVARHESDKALLLVEQAEQVQRAVAAANAQTPEFRVDLARTLRNRGSLLVKLGRISEAEQALGEARSLLEPLVSAEESAALHRQVLASTYVRSGVTAVYRADFDAARQWYDKALVLFGTLYEQQPEVLINLAGLVETHNSLAAVQIAGGDPKQALESAATAIELVESSRKADQPLDSSLSVELRRAYRWRSQAQAQLGMPDEAEADWQRMLSANDTDPENDVDRQLGPALLAAWAGDSGSATRLAGEVAVQPDLNELHFCLLGEITALASECAKSDDEKQQFAERAIQWLEKAEQAGFFQHGNIHTLYAPSFHVLRDDLNFQALLRRVGGEVQ